MSDGDGRLEGITRFDDAVQKCGSRITPSGRAIAAYVRENILSIPFETGASLASRIGVSEMTIIRFIRSLGYSNLKEFKNDLRTSFSDQVEARDDILERFQVRSNQVDALHQSLELELAAVVKAYELTETKRWQMATRLIAERPSVKVVGHQAVKGLALDFSNRLKYARQQVSYVGDGEGMYVEILEADPNECCVVFIDIFAYSRKGVLLARKARESGIPVIAVTDRMSQFWFEFTDLVLPCETQVKTFWDSTASISVVLNLLINAVAVHLGESAKSRRWFLADLGSYFHEFDPSP